MAIYADPTVDYDTHPGRTDFEKIRESGNIDALMNHVEAFIRRGHNPKDPNDSMYRIMGITSDYLSFMIHDFKDKKLQNTDVFFNKAAEPPHQAKPANAAPSAGRQQGRKLGFGPEDDL